jgi:hypothetical protein
VNVVLALRKSPRGVARTHWTGSIDLSGAVVPTYSRCGRALALSEDVPGQAAYRLVVVGTSWKGRLPGGRRRRARKPVQRGQWREPN